MPAAVLPQYHPLPEVPHQLPQLLPCRHRLVHVRQEIPDRRPFTHLRPPTKRHIILPLFYVVARDSPDTVFVKGRSHPEIHRLYCDQYPHLRSYLYHVRIQNALLNSATSMQPPFKHIFIFPPSGLSISIVHSPIAPEGIISSSIKAGAFP